MNSLSVQLLYRPIRVGWCVEPGDAAALRDVTRRNFTLWGGRFNPIIPIDGTEQATKLARLYRVDCLFPASNTAAVETFIANQPNRPWFDYNRKLLLDRGGSRSSTIADISHPIRRLHEDAYRHHMHAEPSVTLHEWDPDDPLDVLLGMTFGVLPPVEDCADDYAGLLRTHLGANQTVVAIGQPVPPPDIKLMTLALLNRAFIEQHYTIQNAWSAPGFYVGDASNFDDLVTFWNLRASNVPLIFYDPAHSARLDRLRDSWKDRFPLPNSRDRPNVPAIWHRPDAAFDPVGFGEQIVDYVVQPELWNGLNLKSPIMHFGKSDALASIDTSRDAPAITFTLTDSPIKADLAFNDQNYIVSIDPGIGLLGNEHYTLYLPFLPQLNEFYGRNASYRWNRVRAEPGSIGIVTAGSDHHLTLRAVSAKQLIAAIFNSLGIEAKPSSAGLVCDRLIRQMGGLDDCRVFRIAGVRALIDQHRPDQSFTRSQAKLTIRGEATNAPLSRYENLYIEPRERGVKLTNDAVFAHLLRKEIFRPGLKLVCPSCELDFWRSVDEVKTRNECEYCGHLFNLGPQLRDRDWAFRRSGLFGRDDHQEGSLPVVLALQQLTQPDLRETIWSAAMTLTPDGADIARCETDFVLLKSARFGERTQIAIGECKTRQAITEQDVSNLMRVAASFPTDTFDVFLVFAKLADFTSEELDHIRAVNENHHRRAILLTTRELEPWHVYERAAVEFEIDEYVTSLTGMAEASEAIFLMPRPKVKANNDAGA